MAMKKALLTGIAALLLTGAAHAEDQPEDQPMNRWQCPGVAFIEVHKIMVHVYELRIQGSLGLVNPIRMNIKELKDGTVILNGHKCQEIKQ
jgi:hypothetical protein